MANQVDEQKGATKEVENLRGRKKKKVEEEEEEKETGMPRRNQEWKNVVKRKSKDDENVSWAACFLIFRLQTISQSFAIGYPYHTEFNLGQHTKNIPNNRFRRFQEGVYLLYI